MDSIKYLPTLRPDAFQNMLNVCNDHWYRKGLNDFYIHKINNFKDNLKLPFPPHRKTVNDFMVITEGEIIRTSGLDTYHITESSVFILPPERVRTTEKISNDVKGYYCHFSTDFLTESRKSDNQSAFSFFDWINVPHRKMSKKELQTIVFLLERMDEIYQTSFDLDLIRSYLNTILTEFKSLTVIQTKKILNAAEILSHKFKQLISLNIRRFHKVEEYAGLLNVSPNHLNKSVKLTVGKTASTIINECLILESKILLHHSSINISDICYSLGFSNPSYFGRFFKKHTNKSPTDFRKMIDLDE